jgi:hypothetical protein
MSFGLPSALPLISGVALLSEADLGFAQLSDSGSCQTQKAQADSRLQLALRPAAVRFRLQPKCLFA